MKNRKLGIAALAIAGIAALFAASCDIAGTFFEDPAPSSDATLKSLSLSVGTLTPAFSKNLVSYTATVPTTTENVTVFAAASDSGASVAGAGSVALGAAGSTTNVQVKVSATDGVATKTYSIDITRAAAGASSEARLATLDVTYFGETVMLDPVFASDTFAYSIATDVPYEYRNLVVTATTLDAGATVSGTGAWILSVGANTKTITVTAADGVAQQTYTISATLLGPESAELSVLELSGYDIGFDPSEIFYSVNVPSGTTTVHLSATPEYAGSTVEYSDDGGMTYEPYTGAVDVTVGPDGTVTYIEVRVTSEYSLTQNTYSIDVTVAEAGASNVATLDNLELWSYGNQIDIAPVFATDTFAYTASVGSAVDEVSYINYAPMDSGATVADPTPFALAVGTNVLKVVVTAADAVTKLTYTVTITRAAPPSIVVANPVAGSTVTTSTFDVTGTFTDPSGEIASIGVMYPGLPPVVATLGAGTFSAPMDLAGQTNGSKAIAVNAFDSTGNLIAQVVVGFTLDVAGAPAGYAVTVNLDIAAPLTDTRYLHVMVADADTFNVMGGIVMGIAVGPDSFPMSVIVDGVPNGEWAAMAFITPTVELNPDNATHVGQATMPVTVADADATYPETIILMVP